MLTSQYEQSIKRKNFFQLYNSLSDLNLNVYELAIYAYLIPKNPVDEVTAPKFSYKQKQVLTDEQLAIFMDAIKEDAVWHDLFYTELTTGLRRGELCGLMWEDFDETEGTLKVRRTVRREKGGGLTTGDTKTYAGTRKIVLPPSTAQLLRERKKTAMTDWIFPNPVKPELPTDPGAAYDRMKALLKKAGLPDIRFHDLRHTFATLALQNGVDIRTVSGMLGHADAGFTLRTYTHTNNQAQTQAAQTVGSVLSQSL